MLLHFITCLSIKSKNAIRNVACNIDVSVMENRKYVK